MTGRTRYRLRAFFFVCATFCGFMSVISLNFDEDDRESLRLAEMSRGTYLRYSRIEQEYGTAVALYWHATTRGLYALAGQMYKELSEIGPELTEAIDQAARAGFRVPLDPHREAELIRQYQRLQRRYGSLVRRGNFLERLKDCLAWIGLAAILVFVGQKVVSSVPPDD